MDRTAVTNLAPLAGMPLEYLTLNRFAAFADLSAVRGITSLKNIGDVAVDRWIVENDFLRNREALAVVLPHPGVIPGAPGATKTKGPALPPPVKAVKADETPPDTLNVDLGL
jgi:hypothetical protein